MLSIKNSKIVNKSGKQVLLKGFNLGGWLMMEGYILHSPNIAEQIFKENFKKTLGIAALKDFENRFRSSFITESDFKNIASLGFNCVRLPFNHRLIENKPYSYSKKGLAYFKKAVSWAKRNKIWVILDLHATAGSQNSDWHSDSKGGAFLWRSKANIKRTIELWRYLANIFKDEGSIAGYDIVNEPITDNCTLNNFYKEITGEIRKIDKNHILFLEPGNWSQDLKNLKRPKHDNIAFSIHAYQPIDFAFNLVPGMQYSSGRVSDGWRMTDYKRCLKDYSGISKDLGAPILVGEFGVNSRENFFGVMDYLKGLVSIFNELDFHRTYWTYKAIKNSVLPDGLYHYYQNPPWVNRSGPFYGWDNYASLWKQYKHKMVNSWQTSSFGLDKKVLKALKTK